MYGETIRQIRLKKASPKKKSMAQLFQNPMQLNLKKASIRLLPTYSCKS